MNKMTKCLSLIVGGLFISSAQADNYLLTMSQNDQVCQHLASILRGDLIEKGKLELAQHKEFNWLKWGQKFSMIRRRYNDVVPNFDDSLIDKNGHKETYASYYRYSKQGSYFDIDNNGVDEFVVFQRYDAKTFNNRAFDSIDIYKGNGLERLSNAEITESYNTEMGYLGGLIDKYTLKEYPISGKLIFNNGHETEFWAKASTVFIRPAHILGTYYIALFGNVDTQINDPLLEYNQTIDEKNAVALIQFTPSYDPKKIKDERELWRTGRPSKEFKDICYFVKTQVIQQGSK